MQIIKKEVENIYVIKKLLSPREHTESFKSDLLLLSFGGTNMNQIEENVVKSFRLAKSDIIKLQSDIIGLSQSQERIVEIMDDIKAKQAAILNPPKLVSNGHKKIYVASKKGKKFHIKECPFAKNIKPKSKLVFKTKTTALNRGYKPCRCIA